MKIENTLENKAKFFAQYFKQRVLITSLSPDVNSVTELCLNNPLEDEYLELKSLSQISDEDAIELMRLKIDSKGGDSNNLSIEIEDKTLDGYTFIVKRKNWGSERTGFVFNGHTNPLSFYDYLRSKGYALPYMGLSVKDLVEYGWVKIK